MNRKILIASCKYDESTWDPVAQVLRKRGHKVVSIETDSIANGSKSFTMQVADKTPLVTYCGEQIDLASFDAAWYRRPTLFGYLEPNAVRQHTLAREVNALQHVLWEMVPEKAWLNTIDAMQHAERKITQLAIARSLGFKTPQTIVTNQWSQIKQSLPKEVIIKSSYGVLDAGVDVKLLYTQPFKTSSLPTDHSPYPGIWQERLTDKQKEWRITIVNGKVFSAAVYTDPDAKDDWRRLQDTNKVRFVAETFPDEQIQKCLAYMDHFRLRFGAFDFVEDSKGNIVFLECNTNGQYGWLEHELGFPITQAVADLLERIALSRQ